MPLICIIKKIVFLDFNCIFLKVSFSPAKIVLFSHFSMDWTDFWNRSVFYHSGSQNVGGRIFVKCCIFSKNDISDPKNTPFLGENYLLLLLLLLTKWRCQQKSYSHFFFNFMFIGSNKNKKKRMKFIALVVFKRDYFQLRMSKIQNGRHINMQS